MIQVTVSDTGIGIQDKDKDKLFELFGFLESSKQVNTKGIGLGLHISQQIVEEFEGEIECESQVGVGTTFCFNFVLDSSEDQENYLYRYRNPLDTGYPKIRLGEPSIVPAQINNNS